MEVIDRPVLNPRHLDFLTQMRTARNVEPEMRPSMGSRNMRRKRIFPAVKERGLPYGQISKEVMAPKFPGYVGTRAMESKTQ